MPTTPALWDSLGFFTNFVENLVRVLLRNNLTMFNIPWSLQIFSGSAFYKQGNQLVGFGRKSRATSILMFMPYTCLRFVVQLVIFVTWCWEFPVWKIKLFVEWFFGIIIRSGWYGKGLMWGVSLNFMVITCLIPGLRHLFYGRQMHSFNMFPLALLSVSLYPEGMPSWL